MNLKDLAKPFPESDIEWRIGQSGTTQKGIWAKVLAYVQARAVMARLDEVCGPENWTIEYRFIEGTPGTTDFAGSTPGVIAKIGILVGDRWVYKEDGAEQTDIESFKGGISGALKRAAVVWGIGRYLYGLEAEFAEISADRKPGFEWAQTKEKKPFYWKPPQLPAWALPEGSSTQRPAAKGPKPKPPESVQKPRAELIAAIMLAADTLKCSQKELAEWGQDLFKKPMTKLTDADLSHFLEVLQTEIGRRGEVL